MNTESPDPIGEAIASLVRQVLGPRWCPPEPAPEEDWSSTRDDLREAADSFNRMSG